MQLTLAKYLTKTIVPRWVYERECVLEKTIQTDVCLLKQIMLRNIPAPMTWVA
jgi:hypothetical protein